MAGPSTGRAASSWWTVFTPNAAATFRLFCLHYAGARAAAFRTWARALPEHVEVCAVQLPGRLNRFGEEPFTRMDALVEALAPELASRDDRPFAIFGHSLGAILAFEVVRWLRRYGRPQPAHLFVSGRRAPHLPDTSAPLHRQSDDELIASLEALQGARSELHLDRDLRRVLLPTLRADFELVETYTYRHKAPLGCAMTMLGGSEDEESLENRLDAWQCHTTGVWMKHLLEGDHFFIRTREQALLALLRAALSGLS